MNSRSFVSYGFRCVNVCTFFLHWYWTATTTTTYHLTLAHVLQDIRPHRIKYLLNENASNAKYFQKKGKHSSTCSSHAIHPIYSSANCIREKKIYENTKECVQCVHRGKCKNYSPNIVWLVTFIKGASTKSQTNKPIHSRYRNFNNKSEFLAVDDFYFRKQNDLWIHVQGF